MRAGRGDGKNKRSENGGENKDGYKDDYNLK